MDLTLLKLKVNDTYNEDENLTTNFEPTDDIAVINKTFLVKNYPQYRVIFHLSKKTIMSLNWLETNSRWNKF